MKLDSLPAEEPLACVEGRLGEDEGDRSFYLPRLTEDAYQGLAVVHWTLTLERGDEFPLDELFHLRLRECLMHTFAREEGGGLVCPVYCVIPDHLHLIWMGTDERGGGVGDQQKLMAFFRTHLKRVISPARLQHQAHDHVLREDERRRKMFATVCNYILENPVEAGLVKSANEWTYSGCVVPGYPDLQPFQENFWGVFWRIYWRKRGEEKRVEEIAQKLKERDETDSDTGKEED
jgi:putative transposase